MEHTINMHNTNDTTPPFCHLGSGCCGSIWTTLSPKTIIKLEDGADRGRSVQNDQTMHLRVLSAGQHHPSLDICIPESHDLLQATDPWWTTNLPHFPPGRTPCRAYTQSRIPAAPKQVRELLIERYCPEAIQGAARASRENEDCLIRVYTGKRRGRPSQFFNLRNYGMCVDQMRDLNLDVSRLVEALAGALALCFWGARVDANDVEFVLAPAVGPTTGAPRFTIGGEEFVLWMLDFDCVRDMPQTAEGVQRAVTAFWRNDAYFPRPHFHGHGREDGELWERFKKVFLEEGRKLGQEGLAKEWVRGVGDDGRMRAVRDGC
jgi:hypothetical protein